LAPILLFFDRKELEVKKMPRTKRQWVSQETGSIHIISRTTGGDILFQQEEKEYFLKQMQRFASGFFVHIHAFAILGNHFHILATGLDIEAKKASKEELYHRYRLMYRKNADPPAGSYTSNGTLIPDADGGVERLRQRLGSISRFVQELKQTFSRFYNKKYNRKGYLWSDRFKGVIVDKGEAQLACSAYIDLNPVRAGLVERPEDYRWSGLGLQVRVPGRAKRILSSISAPNGEEREERKLLESSESTKSEYTFFLNSKPVDQLSWYREFVYISGGLGRVGREGKHTLSPEMVNEVVKCHGKLGIGDSFRYRVKNISEGLAIGRYSFISSIQEKNRRKFVRPRSFMGGNILFATRVLRV
jgi:REP element-mobilizing transposase RayT